MQKRDVSIVIPTYNRAKFLNIVLQTYASQKFVLEIIIVDDGSNNDNDYAKVINKHKADNPEIKFTYLKLVKNYGQAYCRNKGIKLAKGKYILMGEDDVFLDDNYVEVLRTKIITAKKNHNDIFICGNIFNEVPFDANVADRDEIIHSCQDPEKELFDYKYFFGSFDQLVDEDTYIPVGHALVMVESKAYQNVKYFENYKANSFREESDGQIQLAKNGYLGYITSDAYCFHLPSSLTHALPEFKDWIIYHLNRMKYNRIFWKRNYKFCKRDQNFKFSRFYYVVVFDWKEFKFVVKCMWSNLRRNH